MLNRSTYSSISTSCHSGMGVCLGSDHDVEEMAKRSREAEDLEPGGDATGSDVPAHHADLYHSNDSRRPSGKYSGPSSCSLAPNAISARMRGWRRSVCQRELVLLCRGLHQLSNLPRNRAL